MKVRVGIAAIVVAVLAAAVGWSCDGRITPSGVRPAGQATVALAPVLSPHDASVATARARDGEFATSFAEYPILWLGSGYDSDGDGVDDMPLRGAEEANFPAHFDFRTNQQVQPAIRSVSLGYGTCEIPPRESQCAVPITIYIYPADHQLPVPAGGQRLTTLRGVDVFRYADGHLWIETADFTVSIGLSFRKGVNLTDEALRIAANLYGANAKAAGITKDSDFRPKPPPPPTPFPTDPPAPPTRTPTPFPIMTQAPGDAVPTAAVATALPAPQQ